MISPTNKQDMKLGLATIAAGTAAFARAAKQSLSEDELTADSVMKAMQVVIEIQRLTSVLVSGLYVDYETGADGGQHVSDSELPDINNVAFNLPNN